MLIKIFEQGVKYFGLLVAAAFGTLDVIVIPWQLIIIWDNCCF